MGRRAGAKRPQRRARRRGGSEAVAVERAGAALQRTEERSPLFGLGQSRHCNLEYHLQFGINVLGLQ